MLAQTPTPARLRAIRATLFVACLLPLARLAMLALTGGLGDEPLEFVQRSLGLWTLNLLLVTLAVTPLRRLTGWHWIGRLRRMFGLFAFFYACLHFLNWLALDHAFDWAAMAHDVAKRPHIVVGLTAFALLVPLAATSNNAMVRRLGGRRWQSLHRSIYVVAMLGVAHYWWGAEKGLTAPAFHAVALMVLLGWRLKWRDQERRRQLAGDHDRPVRQPGVSVVRFMPRRK
jgi:sulfoxide reductase heme-binding subunit YedZ